MVTKIKDLSLNPESRKIIINEFDYPYLFGENSEFSI
jgi:hypothetical protein